MAIIYYVAFIFICICNICELCTINSTFVFEPGICMYLTRAVRVKIARELNQRELNT